jgi:hypothetical protein
VRLIPQRFSEETPPGERDVFNFFAQSNAKWVVFHSVDIAPFSGQQYRIRRREIDFIAVIPDVGILCIEVKSHSRITFDGYCWQPDSIKISPFAQSSGAAATFFKALKNYWPEAKKIPVVSCCIFPNARFELTSNVQVHGCELMDSRTYRRCKDADDFTTHLKTMAVASIENASNLFKISNSLSNKDIARIIKVCQPFSTLKQSPRENIDYLELKNELLIIQQQQIVIQLFELNSKILVNGGAGTGKTLLAIMLAKKLSAIGLRVALLCHNKLVGGWLKGHFIDADTNVIAGPINSSMLSLCDIQVPRDPSSKFWNGLPLQVANHFDSNPHKKFDVLIIDEAQDILGNDDWLSSIDKILEGGLQGGKYLFLGDFENQLLFNKQNLQANLEILELEYSPTKWFLSENCRNYEEVGENAIRLAGMMESPYSNYLKKQKPSISLYEIETFVDSKDQIEIINSMIKELVNEGYQYNEITLLSFKPLSQASIKVGDQLGGSQAKRSSNESKSLILESILSYKGMENKIIIYFDIEVTNTEKCRDLMYTGITRATDAVRLFVNAKNKETLINWLMAN